MKTKKLSFSPAAMQLCKYTIVFIFIFYLNETTKVRENRRKIYRNRRYAHSQKVAQSL